SRETAQTHSRNRHPLAAEVGLLGALGLFAFLLRELNLCLQPRGLQTQVVRGPRPRRFGVNLTLVELLGLPQDFQTRLKGGDAALGFASKFQFGSQQLKGSFGKLGLHTLRTASQFDLPPKIYGVLQQITALLEQFTNPRRDLLQDTVDLWRK